MNKLSVSFQDFSDAVTAKGFEPKQQGKSVFYIRSPQNAKVEVNQNSGTYTVGFGLKPEVTDQIVAEAEKKGFKLSRRVSGWALLEFISLPKFFDLIKLVDGVLEDRARNKEAERAAKSAARPKRKGKSAPTPTEAEQADNRRTGTRSRKKQAPTHATA